MARGRDRCRGVKVCRRSRTTPAAGRSSPSIAPPLPRLPVTCGASFAHAGTSSGVPRAWPPRRASSRSPACPPRRRRSRPAAAVAGRRQHARPGERLPDRLERHRQRDVPRAVGLGLGGRPRSRPRPRRRPAPRPPRRVSLAASVPPVASGRARSTCREPLPRRVLGAPPRRAARDRRRRRVAIGDRRRRRRSPARGPVDLARHRWPRDPRRHRPSDARRMPRSPRRRRGAHVRERPALTPTRSSPGGLRRDVVDHAVDAAHLVDDARRDRAPAGRTAAAPSRRSCRRASAPRAARAPRRRCARRPSRRRERTGSSTPNDCQIDS